MKKLFTFFTIILFVSEVLAQSPQKMSYQAVIRNSDGALVANTEVGMQISILQGSIFGASVYVESQTPTTNVNGLVSIEIGSEDATILYGSLPEVDWSDGPYFIKTETDFTGGTNYSISGVSQLLSVPYALHAKTAETVTGSVTETDPVFSESEAANITASDITKLDSLSGTNTGDQDLSALVTKSALSDSIKQVRSEISNVGGGVTQAALVDTAANLRSELATQTALGDSTAQVRSEIPDISGFAAQTALVDTAADLRSALATKKSLGDSTAQVRSEIPDISGLASQTALVDTTADLRSTLATKTALGDSITQIRAEMSIIISSDTTSIANPTAGYIIFSTTNKSLFYYEGTKWLELVGSVP